MHMRTMRVSLALGLIASAVPAWSTETIAYRYDAKGRLIAVQRSGSVNNGVSVTYQHDKADNRQRVVITGSSR
jgi:hypothetical protein